MKRAYQISFIEGSLPKNSSSNTLTEGCVVAIMRLKGGGMAEWFKAAVLKTAVPVTNGTVGSNPTPSARPNGEMAE